MYQFVLRVSPSVMISDMMTSFSVDAAGVAFLSSVSLYAYSLMQIPAGILADLWGPRLLISGSVFLCIIGSFCVAITDSFWVALLGRIIIGIGSASAFLSVAKVSLEEFGARHQSLFFGITMMAGTVGALNGGNTIAYLLESITWRQTLLLLCGVGIFVMVLNFFGLRKKNSLFRLKSKSSQETHDISQALLSVLSIFKLRQCWISSIVALGIYSSVSVLADLWGVSFCMQVSHLTRPQAAQLTSLIYVGLCLGSLVIPLLSQKLGRKKDLIIGCLAIIFLNLVFLVTGFFKHSVVLTGILFFNIGFFAGSEMLCFGHACETGSSKNSGTVTGFINGTVMMGGASLQYLVGIILDWLWQGQRDLQGGALYSEEAYSLAFMVILGAVLISFFMSFLLSSGIKKEHLQLSPKGE